MEIAEEPYKKLAFRSYLEYDTAEQLISMMAVTIPTGVPAQAALRWANGVLFAIGQFQQTDAISKQFMDGTLIWDHIDFASMPEYRPDLPVPGKPMITINVLNVSEHTIYGPLSDWIKQNLAKKRSKGQNNQSQKRSSRSTTK